MGKISNVVRTGLVWSAALLTPVTASPRIDCVCPNGHVKLFCLGIFSPAAPCCATNCCPRSGSSEERPARGAACCSHGRHGQNAPAGSRLAGTPCRKTVAEAKLQLTVPTNAADPDQRPALAVALSPVPVLAGVSAGRECLFSRYRADLPPPDLVIALQHLVI